MEFQSIEADKDKKSRQWTALLILEEVEYIRSFHF